MAPFHLLFCAWFGMGAPPAVAQQTDQGYDGTGRQSLLDIIWQDLRIVARDGVGYYSAPLSFDGTQWAVAGGIVGGTVGLLFLDEEIQTFPRNNQQSDLYSTALALTWGGDLIAADITAGLVYLSGLLFQEDELRITGRMLGQSLLYAGTVALGIRVISGRQWPAARKGPFEFDFWQPDDTYQSFPSGHTVVAFSVATVLAERFDHWAASVLLYSAATSVGAARMYVDHHWASDVVLGAALGYITGMYVSMRENVRKGKHETAPVWTIAPAPGGLTLSIHF
ncbi:MAG: phosphatase PAP2 family protein [Bacteroidetes bacterium]|nr:phosphatase PAP2 family protein [Bacteroidota bacterium]